MRERLSNLLIRGLGLLILVLAACVAAFKAPDRPLESLVLRWAPPPSQFLELRLGAHTQLVHWRDEGPRDDALPLLLLHGTGDSLHTWDGWARELAKSRRVLRVDLPGFGLTGPAASGDYRIAAYVDFIEALLRQQGIARVLIAGNSLGGEVAWMTAARHPQRVAGLVLLDPAGLPFEPEHIPLGFAASGFGPTAWLGQHLLPRPLVRASVRAVFGNPDRVTSDLVDRFFEMSLREGNRAALSQRIDALVRERSAPFYPAAWAQVSAPTLLLWGEKDRLIPPRTADAYLKGRRPNAPPAELKILPGLGHVPQLEDPQASLAAALPFIETVR